MGVRKRQVSAWLLAGAFVFVLCGAASAAVWGTGELDTEKTAVKFCREVVKGGYGIVTTEELKTWTDRKEDMLVVDTMPLEDSYVKNHIPGAVQFELPVEEMSGMDEQVKASFEKILGPDKARKLVFYCGFTKCGRSHNGAMWAVKMGYTNVYRYPGGIKGWMEADGKVEKGR